MSTEAWTAALAASDYIGWVVYIDGSPIFEAANAPRPDLNVVSGLILPTRGVDRNVQHWDDLPDHSKIDRLEIYFGRDLWPPEFQPICDFTRVEGSVLRFIQMKQTGLLSNLTAVHEKPGKPIVLKESDLATSPIEKLGITAYVAGCYDPAIGATYIFEVNPSKGEVHCYKCKKPAKTQCRCLPFYHPCWPKPQGLGLSPHVLGLSADRIPDPPEAVRA